jgi:hypothetical protein
MKLIPCPGCGGLFPRAEGPTHKYMESLPDCWAAYGEVMAHAYSDPCRIEYYRLSVAAYVVQHPGRPSRQTIQSVGVHLIRLCLLLECGLEMARANDAIIAASKIKHTFGWLEPPRSLGQITVADVARAKTLAELRRTVRTWAASA